MDSKDVFPDDHSQLPMILDRVQQLMTVSVPMISLKDMFVICLGFEQALYLYFLSSRWPAISSYLMTRVACRFAKGLLPVAL